MNFFARIIRLWHTCLCLSLFVIPLAAQSPDSQLNITLGERRVKFAPTRSFQEMRLEVSNSLGEQVFVNATTEAEFIWNLRSNNDEALAPGLYAYVLTLRFSAEKSATQRGHFIVEKGQDQIWLTAGDGTEISGTALQAARANGRSLATDAASSGTNPRDLNGRTLTPASLDNPGIARVRLAPLFSGSGTTNRVIKWLDGPNGVGGDTVMSEVAGKVGYGTSNPAANLHLFTPGTTDNMVLLMENGTRQWSFGFNGGQDFFRIRDNTAGAARFVIKETGNIGIGVTAPTARLHVINDIGGGQQHAIFGFATGGYGVFGQATGAGYGVVGTNTDLPNGFAGQFNGHVNVSNNLAIGGNISKGGGSFKIDHPLDPANKYLYHSFVESPDMMNIYNGNVTTDQLGLAVITLPDYFETLNREFRYQLTVIGKFAQAIVSEEISGNQFRIQTSEPNTKVSWMVTGVRQDAYAKAHRIPTEELKSETERGSYLHPEVHGQPEEKGLEWVRQPEMMKRLKQQREKAEKEKKSN